MRAEQEIQGDRLQGLRGLSVALTRALDLETLFATLDREVTTLFAADTFFLGLYDEISRTIEVVRQSEAAAVLPRGMFPLGSGHTSEAIRTREPRLIRQWSREGPPVQVQYLSQRPGLPESGLVAPLICADHVLGVIAAYKYEPAAWEQQDLIVFESVAAQASLAIAGLRDSERLNQQLRERVSELQAIFSTMADALLLIDSEGRVSGLNRAARELLCIEDTSLVLGQPLEQQVWGQWPLGTGEMTDALAPMLRAFQRGERPADIEVRLEQHGRRILSFRGAPFFDHSGAVSGCVLIVRDVTTQHDIEEMKDEMLSVASHDLKTPVTVIRTQAQFLRRRLRAGDVTIGEIAEGVESVIGQTQRLSTLLSLLLDASLVRAGRFELNVGPMDLRELTTSIVAEIQATTSRHQLKTHMIGQLTGCWDETRLRQVLVNLLGNAVKYSPNGGPIQVLAEGDGDYVTVRVEDHGVGLTSEEMPHVFERFFRAPATRHLEGSGLGLYISQSIVTSHRGRIWVESRGPGLGTTFWLTLPRNCSG